MTRGGRDVWPPRIEGHPPGSVPASLAMNISSPPEFSDADAPTAAADRPGQAGAVDKSDRRVRRMFASIARRYDLLNHLLSLNIDRSWRRFTTRTVPPEPGVPVLDCCTGTADLALAYDRAAKGRSPVIGSDFCRPMLARGLVKVRKASAESRITLVEGDTLSLPLPDD